MGEWDEKLNDPESEEFKSYSDTITRGIEEMLAQDETLTEQADFNVTIVGFRLVTGLLRDINDLYNMFCWLLLWEPLVALGAWHKAVGLVHQWNPEGTVSKPYSTVHFVS